MATTDDLDKQAKIEQSKHELKLQAKQIADRFEMPLKIVEVEPILGGESVTVFSETETVPPSCQCQSAPSVPKVVFTATPSTRIWKMPGVPVARMSGGVSGVFQGATQSRVRTHSR